MRAICAASALCVLAACGSGSSGVSPSDGGSSSQSKRGSGSAPGSSSDASDEASAQGADDAGGQGQGDAATSSGGTDGGGQARHHPAHPLESTQRLQHADLARPYNAAIDALRATDPFFPGPDPYTFVSMHQSELYDGVHPNDTGVTSFNTLWSQAVLPLYP